MKETSIIYIHGIGSRFRNEEISGLLDGLDAVSQAADVHSIGKARDFSYEEEYSKIFDNEIPFVEFKRIVSIKGADTATRKIKIYECLWSPQAINKYPIYKVLFWLLTQAINPLLLLFAPWRSYLPYKIRCFHQLIDNPGDLISQRLERSYINFEKWEPRRKFPRGSFSEFLTYIRETENPHIIDALILKARKWQSATRVHSASRSLIFLALSIALICFSASGVICAVFTLYFALMLLSGGESMEFIWTFTSENGRIFSFFVVFILVFGAIYRASNEKISDIMYWTMQLEKDERFKTKQEIRSYVEKFISHVTTKNTSADIFIVAHSLGSAIATETISLLDKRNVSRKGQPDDRFSSINRINAIITYGSPIDLIFDSFQIDTGKSHRYSRIEFQRRYTLGRFKYPGSASRQPLIFNFWSRFDPISSPIFSPIKQINEGMYKIANHEVSVPNAANPGAAHGGYIENRNFMDFLYRAFMTGKVAKPREDIPTPVADKFISIGRIFIFILFLIWIFSFYIGVILSDFRYYDISVALLLAAFLSISVANFIRRRRGRGNYIP